MLVQGLFGLMVLGVVIVVRNHYLSNNTPTQKERYRKIVYERAMAHRKTARSDSEYDLSSLRFFG